MKLAKILPVLGYLSLAAAGVHQIRQANEQSTSVATTTTSAPVQTTATTASPSTTTTSTGYRDENSNTGTGITGSSSGTDTDAGASGSQAGSFSLSKGGLIAIIVVVAFVAIFGIASTVLWVLAKRRLWNIRPSIRRASRRFTGRATKDATRDRQSKRAGMQMSSIPAQRNQKRGPFVQMNDVEKGSTNTSGGGSKATQQQKVEKTGSGGKWSEKLWRNDWQK